MKHSVERVQPEPQPTAWSAATLVAFRFCLVYLGLFWLATQVSGSLLLIPSVPFRGFGQLWPMRELTFWVGANVFGIADPLVYAGNSPDAAFYWVQTSWLLALALLAAGVWSALDRQRTNYGTLHKWFCLCIRFGLAAQMFEYGMTKVIPNQFPVPSLITLLEPVGDLSLQGILWTSVGASTPYQIFTGVTELLAGILLIVPRTAILGASVCLAVMTQVLVLNLTYDVGVKLVSSHLVLMTLLLLAPELGRLADFFFWNRATGPSTQVDLFRSRRSNRAAVVLQVMCGIYLLAMQTYANWSFWHLEGGGSPKSPLYGIWNVDELSIDGRVQPPDLNDYDRRWRRVIFDSPGRLVFQRTDNSFARYGVSIDESARTLALTKGESRNWKAAFAFQHPSEDQLILDGDMDQFKIRVHLERVNFDTFRLLNSRFRWTRPPDPVDP